MEEWILHILLLWCAMRKRCKHNPLNVDSKIHLWTIRLSLSTRVTIKATLIEKLQKVCFICAVKLGGLVSENSLYVPKEVDVSDVLTKCTTTSFCFFLFPFSYSSIKKLCLNFIDDIWLEYAWISENNSG